MKKPLILIVDDEAIMVNILGELLYEEYRIIFAKNGLKALERCAGGKELPDLILLDVMMPQMDGYEVCRRLKADATTRDIPIIFLTANTDEKEEARGFEVGGVDYINKPVRPLVVMARVRTHLKLKFMQEKLQKQNAALEQAAQLRDDVERIMRHDLKSPLNNILVTPSVLRECANLSDMEKELLHDIERSGHQMLEMINRSLDLYKMEVGTYRPRLERFDLLPLLHNTATEAGIPYQGVGKGYHLLYNGELIGADLRVFVFAEEMLCYPMFSNLLQNAFEASPTGESIVIDLSETQDSEGEWIEISITNIGVVPAQIRHTFFDKYVTAGKQNGTGLGTYSARLCAEVQNGRIRMEQVDEEKTRVTVMLGKEPVMR